MKSRFEWLAASLCLFACCISRSDRTARQIKEKGEMAYMFVDGNFLVKISCFYNLQIM